MMDEQGVFVRDQLVNDIKSIKKTLKSWTKVFTQIMELQVQNSKQQNQNTILIQQILSYFSKPSKKPQQMPISPIRRMGHKTEPDDFFLRKLEDTEIYNNDNLQNELNNPKKMSIVNYQGTPFDSAYESINREMQQYYEPENQVTEQSAEVFKNFNKIGQQGIKATLNMEGFSLPQSTKNNTDRKNLIQPCTLSSKQLQIQESKENMKNSKQLDMKKIKIKDQRLSTVVEEPSAYLNSQQNTKQVLLSIGGSQNIVQSCQNKNSIAGFEFQIPLQSSVSKTPNNNTKPQNYFADNTRSGSKSLYQNNFPQNIQYINNSNNKQNPIKYEYLSSRAKSFSDQNSKRQPSKKCLDLELIDKQYENSQEILKKTNTLRKT
ncbi:unnamed protein product [Paramecium octaurelia]|uniref:Uncharacterized protein n=1 Tax=Paramecium octaurelia TaxID=43137 RepID=A0A8S1TBQ2_PAROT|nr:unnamed protein product [Paramecium octaurelia]